LNEQQTSNLLGKEFTEELVTLHDYIMGKFLLDIKYARTDIPVL
jgi:hypothetical protein